MLAGALGAVACDPASKFDPIVVDISANCNEVDINVVARDLSADSTPWDAVLGAAVDEGGSDRYWLLLVVRNEQGVPNVEVWHVDGNRADHRLPLTVADPGSLEIRPGPASGEAWIIERSPGVFRLYEVNAQFDPPWVSASGNLAQFPRAQICGSDENQVVLDECDVTDWHRDLTFIEREPVVVSVAPMSPDSTTYAYASVYRRNVGSLVDQQELKFTAECDLFEPPAEDNPCTDAALNSRFTSLKVLGTQFTETDFDAHFFVLREREYIDRRMNTELVLLRIFLDDAADPQGELLSQDALEERDLALVEGPAGLAIDDFATYIMHTVVGGELEMTRFDSQEDFTTVNGLLIPEGSQLLQMQGDVALGLVDDDTWTVTKLFPDAPERSKPTLYEADREIDEVVPAGRGAYLVQKEGGLPDLVHLSCVKPSFGEPDEPDDEDEPDDDSATE